MAFSTSLLSLSLSEPGYGAPSMYKQPSFPSLRLLLPLFFCHCSSCVVYTFDISAILMLPDGAIRRAVRVGKRADGKVRRPSGVFCRVAVAGGLQPCVYPSGRREVNNYKEHWYIRMYFLCASSLRAIASFLVVAVLVFVSVLYFLGFEECSIPLEPLEQAYQYIDSSNHPSTNHSP